MKLYEGQKVRVKAHTEYQHLSHGAVIRPPIEHRISEHVSQIVEVSIDELYPQGDPRRIVVITTDNDCVDARDIEIL